MGTRIQSGIHFDRYIIPSQVGTLPDYLPSSIFIKDGPFFQDNGSLIQAHITNLFPADMTLLMMAMQVAKCRCSFVKRPQQKPLSLFKDPVSG